MSASYNCTRHYCFCLLPLGVSGQAVFGGGGVFGGAPTFGSPGFGSGSFSSPFVGGIAATSPQTGGTFGSPQANTQATGGFAG